jgi:nitrate/TMAO reductase-like tetraheme cytochrome c subunit
MGSPGNPVEGWLAPVVYLSKNLLSRIGVVIVTTAAVLWLFLLPSSLRGEVQHPYIGILAYLFLPGLFFFGLFLIPAGILLHRRAERKAGHTRLTYSPLTLRTPEVRQLLMFIGITTLINIIIGSQVTYRAISYMDSASFCGQTCHQVMQPEYAAYQGSPHSRVDCVACHIGPGASWFVQSKLSGLGQVVAVTFNSYPRPIPTPVRNLRPARETCEACHWPQKFSEDRLRIVNKYGDDEKNTLTKTVLLMRVSGQRGLPGIHSAHLGQGIAIRYYPADESRQSIPRVEYHNEATGRTTVYTASDAKPEALKNLAVRQMDCMDCHNRPTHTFQLADRAVDSAMAAGRISPSLPFIKKTAVEVLKKKYGSQDEAASAIPALIQKFYEGQGAAVYNAHRADIESAGKAVVAIYNRNIFPQMRVTWGTYPNNLGHMDFPGCFRCHDGSHNAADGKSVANDCNTCHQLLAMDEAAPKILTDLGLANGPASQ